MMRRSWVNVSYDLDDVLEILRAGENTLLHKPRRISASDLDLFLYSGRFNSVLGLDGFRIFKKKLVQVVKRVNAEEAGPTLINLDEMFEALLDSGVYYLDEYLPQSLSFLRADERWLTAYRYIAKNFPEIPYDEFRLIVARLKETRGHAIYVEPGETEVLQRVVESGDLFEVVVDVKAALMQMRMIELRVVCQREGVLPARSLGDTVDRLIAHGGDRALSFVPPEKATRRTLVIKDDELATGSDIIHLDNYLRAIAKVMRTDLIDFVQRLRRPLPYDFEP